MLEVTRDAAALPELERLKLARILWDLTDPSTVATDEAEAAWDEEIARRLSKLRSGAVKGVPLAEVKRRIEGGFAS